LRENDSDITETQRLFPEIRENVMANVYQAPEYLAMQRVRHEGSGFIFIRQAHPQ
jgi:hypothetical protein